MTLWRLEGESLPPETQGQVVPEYYGALHKDVPGFPLQVGYSALLSDNCGADLSQTTFLISGPNLEEIRDALTPSLPVVAQIEDEWLYVYWIAEHPWRLGASRAYGGTVAAIHPKGAEVYFVESRQIFVFASSPDGCRYPDDAVVQVRVNDVAQHPPMTIRLQDDRLVPGARLLTVEFDLSRSFGGMAPARQSLQLVPDRPGAGDTVPQRVSLPVYEILRMGPHTPGVIQREHVWTQGQSRPAPPPAPAPSPPATPTAASPLRIRATPLGHVTMDLRGLLDTPAGRYTGTADAPLITPAAITQCLLESTYGETRRHVPTWLATATQQGNLGLEWRLAWRGEGFETFRNLAGYHGVADLWLDDDGFWRYTFRGRPTPVATLTPREILGEIALGFLAPSATVLQVGWGEGLTTGSFAQESPAMLARFGRVTDRALSLPWAASEGVARAIATQWLPWWDRERWTATVAVAPVFGALTRTDRVYLDTPLLATYGVSQWEIRGTTDRGDQRVLTLIECDGGGGGGATGGRAPIGVGRVVEQDAAQAITASLTSPGALLVAVGVSTETDLARGITVIHPHVVAVGLTTETDGAQAIEGKLVATGVRSARLSRRSPGQSPGRPGIGWMRTRRPWL